MVKESMLGQLLELSAWFAIVTVGIDANSASWRKFAPNFNVSRIHKLYEIFHYDINAIFVKVSMISEAKHIEL